VIGPESILISGQPSVAATVTQATAQSQTTQASVPPGPADMMVGRTVADMERDLILKTLDKCLGNRTHAANILGISIRTLRNKLKQYADAGEQVPAYGEP
jgi:two-component system response regulator FlrC